MSIFTVVELQFLPAEHAEGVATLQRALLQSRAFPGCESIDVFETIDDPTRIIMIEQWASADDDMAYRAWRKTAEGSSGLAPFLSQPPVTHLHERHQFL